MLFKAGIKYTENTLSFEAWPSVKGTFPGGVIPCLELNNGKRMGETIPLMRYLGTQHGFYPKDCEKAHIADQCVDLMYEHAATIATPAFMKDPVAKEKAIDNVFKNVLPAALTKLEKDLNHGNFIVGNELCFADFLIGGMYVNFATNPMMYSPDRWVKLLNDFPKYKAYGERFKKEMASYLNSDKRIKQSFC